MVLLVVDAQEAITDARLHAFEKFVLSLKKIIAAARRNGVEVIYIRHDDGEGTPLAKGSAGFEIFSGFAPMEGEKIFDKTVNSPFRESGLLEYLQEKGETTLMVTGLQTEYCIDATVKCGFEHGFEIIVPEYANTTFDNEIICAKTTCYYYNRFIWNRRYARCVSMTKSLELLRAEKKTD